MKSEILSEEVSSRLQYLIRKARTSPHELSKAAGVSPSVVYKMIKGRESIRGITIEKVAFALGVEPGYLAFGEGARPRTVVLSSHKQKTDSFINAAKTLSVHLGVSMEKASRLILILKDLQEES